MRLVVCDWLSGWHGLFIYSRHDRFVELRVVVGSHLRQVLDELDVCVTLVPDQTHEEGEGDNDDLKLAESLVSKLKAYDSVDGQIF